MEHAKQVVDGAAGDRREDDRRRRERRRGDRRLSSRWWRRPPVLVAAGALGMLLLILVVSEARRAPDLPRTDEALLREAEPPSNLDPTPAPEVATLATTGADFEHLVADGEAAIGRLVRVELFCNPISPVSVRAVETMHPSLQAELDAATRKVPAAECKWGAERGTRRDDLLLIVPSDLATDFTSYPMVSDGFVQRRHVRADVEWLGAPDALALRPAGVLRVPR